MIPLPALRKHFIERSHVGAGGDKTAHCLINRLTGFVRCWTRACNVERHRVSDVLVVFAPDSNGVVDVHWLQHSMLPHFYQGAFSA